MSDNQAGTQLASVDALMRGAVDLHCHSGPSVMARLVDHIDAVEEAAAAGMRAVLFKDHYYPTAPIVELIRERYAHLGVEPLGAIVLNNALGGFNAYAVEHALKMGSKVVWMPTVSAANHIREGHNKKLLVAKSEMRRATALSVVDEHGDLRDEVKPILDLVAEHDAVLSCGHLHISEVWPLFEEARRRGCNRLLVNHPTYTVGATVKDFPRLVELGVYIEHSICMFIELALQVVHARTAEELYRRRRRRSHLLRLRSRPDQQPLPRRGLPPDHRPAAAARLWRGGHPQDGEPQCDAPGRPWRQRGAGARQKCVTRVPDESP